MHTQGGSDPICDTQLYGINTLYINFLQQYAQLCLFLTTKFYLFLITYKLTFCDYGEFETTSIIRLSGSTFTIWQFIVF